MKALFAILLFLPILATAKEPVDTTLTHEDVLNFASQTTKISVCKVRLTEQGLLLGASVECDPKATGQLTSLLSDPSSYEEGGHRCGFSPNYLIRMTGKNGQMNLLLCYGCRDYEASMPPLRSQTRSFAPAAQAIKAILDHLPLKDPHS